MKIKVIYTESIPGNPLRYRDTVAVKVTTPGGQYGQWCELKENDKTMQGLVNKINKLLDDVLPFVEAEPKE